MRYYVDVESLTRIIILAGRGPGHVLSAPPARWGTIHYAHVATSSFETVVGQQTRS